LTQAVKLARLSNLIKTVSAILLSVIFMLVAIACTQNEGKKDSGSLSESTKASESATDSESIVGGGLFGGTTDGSLSYYLQLSGIEGECKDPTHDRWIEVTEFSHGASYESYGGLPEYEEGETAPVVFVHKVDKATPKFQAYCMKHNLIPSGKFCATKTVAGRQTEVYKGDLENLRIASTNVYSCVDGEGATELVEEVIMLAEKETVTVASKNDTSVLSNGQLKYYVKLNGVSGESKNSQHSQWIDVIDFSHGSYQEIYSDEPELNDSSFKPITFTHKTDKATPTLLRYCLNGNKITSGELHVTKSIAGKDVVVYKITLAGIRITNSTVRTVTDENGNTYLIEEISMLVEKQTWNLSSAGLDNADGGGVEEEFDQSKKT
ncbi:MAG: type VI secretion system tube protein Hcp, partial [Clostridia bacterium]|nr:type VI secretion system tube protein Hcp [Clostridia bacterium]